MMESGIWLWNGEVMDFTCDTSCFRDEMKFLWILHSSKGKASIPELVIRGDGSLSKKVLARPVTLEAP